MVEIASKVSAVRGLRRQLLRFLALAGGAAVVLGLFFSSCTARVMPNEFGVEQSRFGTKVGVVDQIFGPGLYFIGPGSTMFTYPREIHLLEASNERAEARAKAGGMDVVRAVDQYYSTRDALLGKATHRVIDAFNVQTSDGYSVAADVTLLYSITDPLMVAREFGWGSTYVESFAINTFRNGVLATLGKMNAESFYDEKVRIAAVNEAEEYLRERFKARGFEVHKLLLRNYSYSPAYEKSLHEKKVAVQAAEKNRKESHVNDERAKLQQIESKGNAAITIAESENNAQISKVRAEANLYSEQVRAKGDKEYGLANAEAKRLKAEALNKGGGRYVVALETAKIFDNIQGSVMTPEQYITFIRQSWALIGLSPGGPVPAAEGGK